MKRILLSFLAVFGVAHFAMAGNKIPVLSQSDYKNQVEDYTTSEWDYKGELPAVVDFYADWCGPCRKLAPIMEEVAAEFEGKVKFYKVNVDNAQALARAYGVSSIPMVLFIPAKGEPVANLGLMSKADFVKKVQANCLGK